MVYTTSHSPSNQRSAWRLLKTCCSYVSSTRRAADHGYSEAIYLEDFEGNGIEVYHDKPVKRLGYS